jgi:hypothetical protein
MEGLAFLNLHLSFKISFIGFLADISEFLATNQPFTVLIGESALRSLDEVYIIVAG